MPSSLAALPTTNKANMAMAAPMPVSIPRPPASPVPGTTAADAAAAAAAQGAGALPLAQSAAGIGVGFPLPHPVLNTKTYLGACMLVYRSLLVRRSEPWEEHLVRPFVNLMPFDRFEGMFDSWDH